MFAAQATPTPAPNTTTTTQPEQPAANYYTFHNGAQAGPFTLDALLDQVRSGEVDRSTMVWQPGQPQWRPAADVPEIAEALPPEPPKPVNYYVVENGQQAGPFTFDQMMARIQGGETTASDFAWKEGMEAWAPASTFPEFAEALKPAPTPPPTPPSVSATTTTAPSPPPMPTTTTTTTTAAPPPAPAATTTTTVAPETTATTTTAETPPAAETTTTVTTAEPPPAPETTTTTTPPAAETTTTTTTAAPPAPAATTTTTTAEPPPTPQTTTTVTTAEPPPAPETTTTTTTAEPPPAAETTTTTTTAAPPLPTASTTTTTTSPNAAAFSSATVTLPDGRNLTIISDDGSQSVMSVEGGYNIVVGSTRISFVDGRLTVNGDVRTVPDFDRMLTITVVGGSVSLEGN
jgi:hypothetical protein